MKIKGILKKSLAVSLCALMLGGAAVAVPEVITENSLTVSAAQTFGDYEYEINGNEVTITHYNGSDSSIVIPSKINGKSVTKIQGYAFEYKRNLKSVIIPDGVTDIGFFAFWHCYDLTNVILPDSLINIEENVFFSCTSLKNMKIPVNVKNIGEGTFCNCTSLTSIEVDSDNKYFSSKEGVLYNKNKTSLISCPMTKTSVTIPDGVKNIEGRAFEKCAKITSLTLPKSIRSIGDSAFYSCTSLNNITLPNSVTSIGDFAFYSCTSLNNITLPNSVTSIGSFAFYGCQNLKSITMPEKVSYLGQCPFLCCTSLESLVIPNGVTVLKDDKGGGFLENCSSLKSVIIPDSVTKINYHAFNGCTSLKSVIIPDSVVYIEDYAFGYYYDKKTDSYKKVSDFTIYGKKGSVAEKYAKEQGYKFIVEVEPLSVILNKTAISLGKGETTKLTATVAPSNATNKSVKWRTSDSKVLTVDKNGNVKAVGNGTAWITAKTSNGKEKSCKITVKNAPSKVTISKGVVTIGVGEKFTVGSAVPDGSAAAKRTYRTSNSSIVKMTRTDWQGDFVGVKPGTAYVTVRTYNGKESTCKVTVKAAPSSVTISKKTMTMKVGQTATLSCSVPSDAGCATRTYRTSNSSVVKMTKTSWTGTFKALKKGTAYVTVRTYNGKESSCKITVV